MNSFYGASEYCVVPTTPPLLCLRFVERHGEKAGVARLAVSGKKRLPRILSVAFELF
jgi:hypothetical protein